MSINVFVRANNSGYKGFLYSNESFTNREDYFALTKFFIIRIFFHIESCFRFSIKFINWFYVINCSLLPANWTIAASFVSILCYFLANNDFFFSNTFYPNKIWTWSLYFRLLSFIIFWIKVWLIFSRLTFLILQS
jgi:hypothetical protein